MINKLWTITLFFLLISLATAAVNIGETPEDIRGVVIQYPTISSSSSSGNITACTGNFACLNESETVTGAWTFSNNITLSNGATIDNDEKIFYGYNNIVQTNIINAWRYVNVDSEIRKDNYYTHTTGASGDTANVTVSRTGRYTIDYNLCVETLAEIATINILQTRLIRNGITPLSGSLTYNMILPANGEVGCVSNIIETNLTANDKVAIQALVEDGGLGSTNSVYANTTGLHIRWTGI